MKLYETLQQNLGKQQAEALLMFVDNHLHEKDTKNEKLFASKEAMKEMQLQLKQEIIETKTELKQEIAEVKAELKQEIAETRLELKQDIAQTNIKIIETKTDIIRWLLTLFIPLLMAIIGLYVKR